MAMIFVSHDIAVVAGLADEIAVMYGGRIVEHGAARPLVHDPRMPYSDALLRSSPRLDQPRGTTLAVIPGRPPSMIGEPARLQLRTRVASGRPNAAGSTSPAARRRRRRPPLRLLAPGGRRWRVAAPPSCARDRPMVLAVTNLVVEYPAAHGERVHAVSDVSFDIAEGETLGLVGESGCGKSTTAEAVTQLVQPPAGSVVLDGIDLSPLDEDALRPLRPRFQMIFQDPLGSLNPRRRVRDIVAEPLRMWRTGEQADWDSAGARDPRRGRSRRRRGRQPATARVLRRPGPAHQHRQGARAAAAAARVRRAGVVARRLGAGADHQPARLDAAAASA